MSIWGKIIGGVAGFALGGPLGALVGGLAGHAVDKIRGAQEGPEQLEGPEEMAGPTGAKKVAFTVAVIVLGAKMAKVDGAVSRAEIKAFKEVFHIPPEEVKNVGRIFDMAKKDAGRLRALCQAGGLDVPQRAGGAGGAARRPVPHRPRRRRHPPGRARLPAPGGRDLRARTRGVRAGARHLHGPGRVRSLRSPRRPPRATATTTSRRPTAS